jgi:hypothetical protein
MLANKTTSETIGREPTSMSATQLADELASLAAHIDAARCRWLELLAEFDRRGEWGDWIGATSCADWLSWRCAVGTGEAREFVRVAGRLRELPLLHAAFARGELSYSKLRLVSEVADAESEEKLLDLASRVSTGQLQRLLRSYARVTKDEARLAHEQEFLDYEWDEDGSLIIRGRLPAEDGALLLPGARGGARLALEEAEGAAEGGAEGGLGAGGAGVEALVVPSAEECGGARRHGREFACEPRSGAFRRTTQSRGRPCRCHRARRRRGRDRGAVRGGGRAADRARDRETAGMRRVGRPNH